MIAEIKTHRTAKFVAGILLLSSLLLLKINFNKVDESKTFLVEDYTKDMLRSIDSNGVVLSYEWDYFVSAAYYFQLVEKIRPDVVVVDKELLRRSWYFPQLEHRYPWLIAGSKRELDAYLAELGKFEHNLPYDPERIESRYNALIHSFIQKNYGSRPVYATPEIEPEYTTGFNKVPSGLTFRLYRDSLYHEQRPPAFSYRQPQNEDTYINGTLSLYANAYLNYAIYSNIFGKNEAALHYLAQALTIRPDLRQALYLRDKIVGAGKLGGN